jgi:choline monooxygenase
MNAPFLSDADYERLRHGLDRGLSLPAAWYTSPAVLERERERIFHRGWQYVGPAEQVAGEGGYLTAPVGEIPVVVVRDRSGLNAFVNVCRHRRHPVMSGAGTCRLMRCPYHAWTYGLDGTLRAAPRGDDEEGFAKEDYPLLPVRVETWGPLVFVNPDPGAAPLSASLAGVSESIAASGLELEQLRFHGREEWSASANWKVMLENYLECYHCPVAHPGFSAVVDVRPDQYTLHAGGEVFSQVAPVRAAARQGTRKTAYDAAGTVSQAQYHLLWPNSTLDLNPGHPNLTVTAWTPGAPDQTGGFADSFFGPDVPEAWAQSLIEFNRQVGVEDDALTDAVQRGLRAGLPVQGRFLSKSEALVIAFQRRVLDAVR